MGSEATDEQVQMSLCHIFLATWQRDSEDMLYMPELTEVVQHTGILNHFVPFLRTRFCLHGLI